MAGETYDRAQNDLHVELGTKRDLIDYILIRDQENQFASTSRQIKMIRENWALNHADLSDHFALEAEIKFAYPTFLSNLKQGRKQPSK